MPPATPPQWSVEISSQLKKLDLGQSLTLLANVGVIGGILLLAYELRQNNNLMAAEARFNRLAVPTENWTLLAQEDFAELRSKDINDQEMTPIERLRWEAYSMRVLATREWSFRELPRSEKGLSLMHENNSKKLADFMIAWLG